MLYKFKSKVTSDVLMLEANGREILQIIGKFSMDDPQQGIIRPDEMAAAIAALESALDKESKKQRETPEPPCDEGWDGVTEPPSDPVLLRQRATPFLHMLRQALAHEQPIVWGV